MHKFSFKEFEVEHIVKSKLKNSYLSIDKNFHIILKTPKVSSAFVEELLLEKETWLRKQYETIANNQAQKVNLENEVLLFGEVISIDSQSVQFLQKKLLRLTIPSEKNILKLYNDFYKHMASEYLPQRVAYFSSLMQLSFHEIKYRKMKRRWGSCSSTKVITLNTQLLKVEKELIDYVIVHELAHLKHMNHSREFHSLVERYLPDSKKLRQKLKNIQII